MTMRGMAFLPIWHGIADGHDEEFERWHTVEHLPERVATPGILAGRRYAKAAGEKLRYFTLYEAASFEVFASEGYYATANARSAWTMRVHPHFVDFLRAPCHLVMTRGRGYGGALLTVRVRFTSPQGPDGHAAKDAYTLAVRPIVEAFAARPLVTGAHAGVVASVARKPLSAQSLSLRPGASEFDGVILVEFASRGAMELACPAMAATLEEHLRAFADFEMDRFDLSQVIAARDG